MADPGGPHCPGHWNDCLANGHWPRGHSASQSTVSPGAGSKAGENFVVGHGVTAGLMTICL
jgi:hypothetical protein